MRGRGRRTARREATGAAPLPEHLEDAAEWVGRSADQRGQALRGLLRTSDRIARSRGPRRRRAERSYPQIDSRSDAHDA